MGVTIQHEEGDVRVMRITGLLRRADLSAAQDAEAAQWGPETRVKLLVIAEAFEGWDRRGNWGDISFLLKHGNQIEKIAIVADPKWED